MRRWCPDCRRMQAVDDTDLAPSYTPRGEVGQPVAALACGHVVQTGSERLVGPAPGAPYVGTPDRPVARSHRPADLVAADAAYTERTQP